MTPVDELNNRGFPSSDVLGTDLIHEELAETAHGHLLVFKQSASDQVLERVAPAFLPFWAADVTGLDFALEERGRVVGKAQLRTLRRVDAGRARAPARPATTCMPSPRPLARAHV
ncbi:MAG TPA: hypothetical protein VK524_05535 [Polyangiaceae bacterium]|nr:hypothetical protein [Polyangiaceae bacterium]